MAKWFSIQSFVKSYGHYGKHHLSDVESMSPVVVSNVTIILFDTQKPTAENFVIDVKSSNQVKVKEHSQTGLLFNKYMSA